jgi:predicted nucleotidyltransferase
LNQPGVFGSLARGNFWPDSDIDLILVVDTAIPFTKRPPLFDDLYELFPALDALIYSPAEFKRLTEDPSPGFWHEVTETMRRIL